MQLGAGETRGTGLGVNGDLPFHKDTTSGNNVQAGVWQEDQTTSLLNSQNLDHTAQKLGPNRARRMGRDDVDTNPHSEHPTLVSGGQQSLGENKLQDHFQSSYLRLLTIAYSSDLDKLREVPDFKEHSVPILIQALKQSASVYNDEERDIIMSTAPERTYQGR